MERKSRGCGCVVIPVLLVLIAIGLVKGEPQESPQEVPVASPTAVSLEPTPALCFEEYYQVADDTLNKLPEAISLALVDALIQRYDRVAQKLPLECGDASLLDQTDTFIRLALGAQRTAIMKENALIAEEARTHAENARRTLERWAND